MAPTVARAAGQFVSERDGNTEIYSMRADGSQQTNLTRNEASDERPVWSPDGSKIAWPRQRGEDTWDIWTMDADGGHQMAVTSLPGIESQPAWSPDGEWIVSAGSPMRMEPTATATGGEVGGAGGTAKTGSEEGALMHGRWSRRSRLPLSPVKGKGWGTRTSVADLANYTEQVDEVW